MAGDTNMRRQARNTDPGVLDTACRQLKQQLGCSDEQAFELLYGWAETCKGTQAFGLTQMVTRGAALDVFWKKWKKC